MPVPVQASTGGVSPLPVNDNDARSKKFPATAQPTQDSATEVEKGSKANQQASTNNFLNAHIVRGSEQPSTSKPKVVLSGLMGWEAAPCGRVTCNNIRCDQIDPSPIPLSESCPQCGALYLRRYHHLFMGLIVRCIWCGATWHA